MGQFKRVRERERESAREREHSMGGGVSAHSPVFLVCMFGVL